MSDTTFPLISKADIAKARELIEQETGMSKRTFELVDTIWPRTTGEEPATLYTVEATAQMDDFAGAQAELHAEMDETKFLLRGNNHARLEASIANLDNGRFTVDGTYKGVPYRLSVGPVESGTDEDRQAFLDEIQKVLEEPEASPFVLTKMGRVADLTEEDLDGFEFLPVEHEPDDAAVVAKTIQDMSLEEKIALGRSMLEGVESHLDEPIEGGPFFDDDEDDDLPTPIASYDAYVLSHRFKDVMAECEEGGNLHILVSDANVEDDDVAYLADKAETPAEKACIELAAQLSPGERWAAWLIANGREAEARGRCFAAQDTPPEVITELRAFIDSLGDDTLTDAEQQAYREETREANRLATETSQQHGVALHPRVAALRAGDDEA